jgi:lysophospholipase L1-like esterase
MSPRALRLVVAGGASLLALGAGELVARAAYGPGFLSLADPYEHHPYRAGVEYVDEAGHRIATNSLGWKDATARRAVARDPAPRRRVVFLGDSFTEGLGLPADETPSAFAEAELGGDRYEVLNGGRVSYSPLLEYQRLKRFLAHGYRADAVVVLPDLSDVQDELAYAGEYEYAADGEPLRLRGSGHLPPVRWLYNRLALARWTRRGMQRLAGRTPPAEVAHAGREIVLDAAEAARLRTAAALPTAAYLELSPEARAVLRHAWVDHAPSREGWARDGLRRLEASLARLHALAERRGMRFLVVVYPWPQVLYTEHDPARYRELRRRFPRWFHEREQLHGSRPSAGAAAFRSAIREVCAARSIPFLDLFPAFSEDPDWPLLFLAGDVHFSPAGSRLVGREIARAVRRGEPEGR